MTMPYRLDAALKVVQFDYSDGLRGLHKELESSRQLDHHLTPEEETEKGKVRVIRPGGELVPQR
jgi:hypothetical protein